MEPINYSDPSPIYANRNRTWSEIWSQAITQPNLQSYQDLMEESNRTLTRAFLWLMGASAIGFLIQLPLTLLSDNNVFEAALGSALAVVVCFPFLIVIGFGFYLLGQAIIFVIAKVLGGKGEFTDQVWLSTAYSAPASLVSAVLGYLNLIPCIGALVSLGFALYTFVLGVIALNTVHQYGWFRAVATLILPLLLFVFFICCVLIVLGGATADVFENIQSTLDASQ